VRLSDWARRFVAFAYPVLGISVTLTHNDLIDGREALALYTFSFALAGIAFVLAWAAIVEIWARGGRGAGTALLAIGFSGTLIAVPLTAAFFIWSLPLINDAATDPDNAPVFNTLAPDRLAEGRETVYDANRFWSLQREAFPELVPLTFDGDYESSLALLQVTAARAGLRIVSLSEPTGPLEETLIEAEARTLVFGFKDDVAFKLYREGEFWRLDMRSSSRLDGHDMGTNARRIMRFIERYEKALADAARL